MDYVLVYKDNYDCKKCGKKYKNIHKKWCKLCLISHLKNNFTNWTENKEIDNFIQEMQSRINSYMDNIIEWIPYSQFIDIKMIEKDDVNTITIYSAIWKNGPLVYDSDEYIYKRRNNYKKVALKCLNNSQNKISELLNEVLKIFII
jgi:hypothetical protein